MPPRSGAALTWQTAHLVTDHLYAQDDPILDLVARLPLVWPTVLQRLRGLADPADLYRRLKRLTALGLLAALSLPWRVGHSPRLYHLTDLGLAVLARDWNTEPADFARCLKLRRADLLARLPGLPVLLDAYAVLAALTVAGDAEPQLRRWASPWRARFSPPFRRHPIALRAPALAELAWDDVGAAYAILPDRGVDLRAHRPLLDHLTLLHSQLDPDDVPFLIILTQAHRASAWERLLDHLARHRNVARLPALVTDHDRLEADVARVASDYLRSVSEADDWLPARLPAFTPRRPSTRLPRLVGSLTEPGRA